MTHPMAAILPALLVGSAAAAAEPPKLDPEAARWAQGLDLKAQGTWSFVTAVPRFGTAIVYIDRPSLKRSGSIVTARFRSEFREPAPVTTKAGEPDYGKSVLDTRQLNCTAKTERLIEATFFRQNNFREPFGAETAASTWSETPATAVSRTMLEAGCQ